MKAFIKEKPHAEHRMGGKSEWSGVSWQFQRKSWAKTKRPIK